MMEGWKFVKLGDIIHIKHGYGFKGEFFVDEPTKNFLLTPGNFAIGGGYKSDKIKYYDGPINEDFILKEGDVIVTMTDLSKQADTLGYSAKIPKDSENTYLHNQRIGLISLKTDEVDLDFIYWLLRTDYYQRYIASSSSGATVKHTSPKKIYSAKLLVPESLFVQQKIASILSGYDDLIENNLKRIKLLEEKAQLTYEEWFVRMKFPGHESVVINKETGLPEGWRITKLNKLSGVNSKNIEKTYEGDIKYIDIKGVSPNSIDSLTEYSIVDAPGRAKRIVKHGDIIWSCVRPNRRSHAVVWKPESNWIASTGFCVISPKKLPTSYLYYFLTTNSFVGYLTNLAGGAAYPAVKADHFKTAEIVVPKDEIVKAFDEKFEKSLELIWNFKQQNQFLKEARDILLPRLMAGMINVEDMNISSKEAETAKIQIL
ncbi:restriction endonuclease subunit S [Christiangramia forsetii]|uniref:Type I restriction-modification system DNA specificity subunit n=2 Tax=Christiangramia forsetii TaxID=411153 RepID=A0M4K2_CHRFK|nr:restriction endonuclease subunit S [Christiangramia forsetii]GGG23253.1 hypothetical protein GCM10011532_02960 [Christiangramia forsetii]CAL67547.1 type I restriction-modification system DNA specificity subunit [Christiangramia forsetii KT0803]